MDLPTFWHKMRMCAQGGTTVDTNKRGKEKKTNFCNLQVLGRTHIGKSIDPVVGILATTKRERPGKRWNRTWLIDPVRMLGAQSLGKLEGICGD